MKKILILTILSPLLLLVVTLVDARGQTSLVTIIPVISVDAARLTSELAMLIKAAEDAKVEAEYWKDACLSTPQCSTEKSLPSK